MIPPKAIRCVVTISLAATAGCAQYDGVRSRQASRVGSVAADAAEPAQGYDPSAPGPYKLVRMMEADLVDAKRNNRLVATRITAPEGTAACPLVIMSHGLGGNLESHASLVDHIASHGYIVLAPNHPASDTQRVFKKEMKYATGDEPALDPAAVLGRAPDVSFLIDQAEKWNADSGHPLHGRILTDKVAVAGHSFGAFTAYTVCGARPILDHLQPAVAPGKGLAPSMRDPRVDVGIAYSPQGPGGGFFSDESFDAMRCPMLIFSGSRDEQGKHFGKGNLPPETRYRTFELMPAGDKYYLWLFNAGHMGWADMDQASALVRLAGRLTTPESADVIRISGAMSVAFLDAYLLGNPDARAKLNEAYAQSLTGKVIRRIRWSEK